MPRPDKTPKYLQELDGIKKDSCVRITEECITHYLENLNKHDPVVFQDLNNEGLVVKIVCDQGWKAIIVKMKSGIKYAFSSKDLVVVENTNSTEI